MLKSYRKGQLKIRLTDKAQKYYNAVDPLDLIAETDGVNVTRCRVCGEGWNDYEREFDTIGEMLAYLEERADEIDD